MLGGADNPNGELPSYITGADIFPFCTGKYRWHGSTDTYTGREVQDIPGVLAVFAERRKDSFGPYVRLMSVTLN